jgi:hypothetical protein
MATHHPTERPTFTATELVNELWQTITGYEGLYSVSTLGRVRSDRAATSSFIGRICKQSPKSQHCDYLAICLIKNGVRKSCLVHHLVMDTFVGPLPKGYQRNHKDTNRYNNRLSNLEHLTFADHGLHNAANALNPRGERNGFAQLTDEQAIQIIHMINAETDRQLIANRFSISVASVDKIASGKNWAWLSKSLLTRPVEPRKPSFTEAERSEILALRASGMTFKAIAARFDVYWTRIQKLCAKYPTPMR